jgi:hypothetical protein
MTFRNRFDSPTRAWASMFCSPARAWASTVLGFVVLATCAWACGGGSSLDEYEDGVPGVVPSPVSSLPDAGRGRDGGTGNRDGGAASRDGGGADNGEIGAACDNSRDCDDDGASCELEVSLFGLLTYELEGGYCTTTGCQSNEQCPDGAGCFVLTGNCLKKCDSNSQCRVADNYQCANLDGSQSLCVPEQAAADVGSIAGLAGGLFGGGSAGAGGTLSDLGGLLGGAAGGGGTGFFGGLFGGGGTGGAGGMD